MIFLFSLLFLAIPLSPVSALDAHTHSLVHVLSASERLQRRIHHFRQMSSAFPAPAGYTAATPPKSFMDLKPAPAKKSLLETSIDVDVSDNAMDKNPLLAVAWPGFAAARKLLRQKEKFTYENDVQAPLNKFVYKYYTDGSVYTAAGYVNRAVRVDLSDAAYFICDTTYKLDYGKDRVRTDWHTGHVVAAALGGDNFDPINFFAQHSHSNSGGGVWWRMEMIIGAAQDVLNAAGAFITTKGHALSGKPCVYMIKPQLNYEKKASLVPSLGWYTAELEESCFIQLTTVLAPKSSYALAMIEWAKTAVKKSEVYKDMGVAGLPGYAVSYKWFNEYDKADKDIDASLFKA